MELVLRLDMCVPHKKETLASDKKQAMTNAKYPFLFELGCTGLVANGCFCKLQRSTVITRTNHV